MRRTPIGTEENKRVVEQFDALLNTQDLGQLDELCTPDMVNHTLVPGRPGSKAPESS